MGVENLNWLIFIVVAGLSAVMGVAFIVRMWGIRPLDGTVAWDRRAIRARYIATAAVGVECLQVAIDVWLPGRLTTGWLWGVQTMHLVDLIGFWSSVGLLAMALVTVGKDRSDLGIEVRIACWTLLGISLTGGSLFLMTQR
jgi:hypothetical protein